MSKLLTGNGGEEFDGIAFEKRLTGLKDSQDSINSCCLWCLENRNHHKKIVSTWLNVLKRVRVDQRLTLFYLANDVIQYSKRKNYEYVESWGTALQKATTMVRDEKVKHKILRIFKIWEQRNIYGEEFITDLSGLISASPSSKKTDESHEFQSSHLIHKIKNCARLEADTDDKLTLLKQHNPRMLDAEALVASLKDRAHVDDVEKEMEDHISHMEQYINALNLEIKARSNLINLLLTAETQLEKDRKDVKVVAVAYKSFATRVKNLKKKLDEKKTTLHSPVPSPDVNAPSPSPDSDDEFPDPSEMSATTTVTVTTTATTKSIEHFTFTNAGFYNPVSGSITDTTSSFVNNGFSSFLGSNMSFNIQNLNTSSLFNNTGAGHNNTTTTESIMAPITQPTAGYASNLASLFPSISQQPPPPPEPVPPVTQTYNPYTPHVPMTPLVPPPLPPFTKSDSMYNADGMYSDYNPEQISYTDASSYNTPSQPPTVNSYPVMAYNNNDASYGADQNYNSVPQTPVEFPTSLNPPNPAYAAYDPYNPEEEPETWDNDENWEPPPQSALDTPASPPPLDKQSFMDPIEYHDGQDMGIGERDVDHRVLNILTPVPEIVKKKDVDHRNLISLTGSPKDTSNSMSSWSSIGDQDYRVMSTNITVTPTDQDYRQPPQLQPIESVSIPPPPTPPASLPTTPPNLKKPSPKKTTDNTESIDMDLSDDEAAVAQQQEQETQREHVPEQQVPATENEDSQHSNGNSTLLPPPPFPDDMDANNLLDSLNEDLDEYNYDMYESYSAVEEIDNQMGGNWDKNQPPPMLDPMMLGGGEHMSFQDFPPPEFPTHENFPSHENNFPSRENNFPAVTHENENDFPRQENDENEFSPHENNFQPHETDFPPHENNNGQWMGGPPPPLMPPQQHFNNFPPPRGRGRGPRGNRGHFGGRGEFNNHSRGDFRGRPPRGFRGGGMAPPPRGGNFGGGPKNWKQDGRGGKQRPRGGRGRGRGGFGARGGNFRGGFNNMY